MLLGGATALLGLAVVPLWVQWTVALTPLHADDVVPLWLLAAAATALGVYVMRRRPPRLAALLFPLLLLVGGEVVARLYLRFAASPEALRESIRLAGSTYPDGAAFVAHPFLQFTGRPRRELSGGDVLGESSFNNLGFVGPDVTRDKPAGVVRVAFLGGSTTATGYFRPAEKRLNELAKGSAVRFECINFSIGYYTSMHSTVNFVVNVRDYKPDYVVFLHGWNDLRGAGHPDDYRGDYSHSFKPFALPPIRDALFLRSSVMYRYVQHRIAPTPDWANLGVATQYQDIRHGDTRALLDATYLRNIGTVVTLAEAGGIVPVLVTQAHSTDPKIAFAQDAEGIAHYAALCRQAAEGYGDRVVFVDLDKMTTGIHNEFFRDVGHHNEEGVRFKGLAVAEAIWARWSKR